MSDPMFALGRDVRAALDRARNERGLAARVRERVIRGEPRTARARAAGLVSGSILLRRVGVTAAFAVAASVALVWGLRPSTPRALQFTADGASSHESDFVAASGAPRDIRFSDGSDISVAPAAHVRVLGTSENGARVAIERGTARVHVVHRDNTSWQFVAGPYHVDVIGTSFELSWSPDAHQASVRMIEGRVMVRGCELGAEGRALVAGESLTAQCPTSTASNVGAAFALPEPHAATPSTFSSGNAAATTVASASAKAVATTRVASSAPATSTLAVGLAAEDADALWTKGSNERAHGNTAEARASRLGFRKQFPRDARAHTAAFDLGQLAFDAQSDFAEANTWFSTYLREAPQGALVREAMGRAMEARHKLGDANGAASLAREYRKRWPGGPHDALARELTEGGVEKLTP